ncbi:uncharacterized protein CCR75_000105 [Bremia lactucae]|uniref:MYND-type domain-containing protein n=1 Tax=Bremia lactucae TaxID=4779 RepID=A0A976IHT6_BRELC|nr:hypothetical protein CCR75_000105 [Bremia lactucae]
MTLSALIERNCLSCRNPNAKNRCGGCRRAYFCNRDCQRQSWKSHRPSCLPSPVKSLNDLVHVSTNDIIDAPVTASPFKCVDLATGPVHVTDISVEPSAATPKSKKKSAKNKKKRIARSNSMHLASTSTPRQERKNRSASLGGKKHVLWGDVQAREFARFPGGGSAVPYDGTWALGLGNKVADIDLGTVLEVEKVREMELQERANNLSKSKRRNVSVGETRQFDYRRGVDNPLFSRLSEDERKKVFTQDRIAQEDLAIEAQLSSSSDLEKPRRKYSTRSASIFDNFDGFQGYIESSLTSLDFGCVSIEQLDEFARIRDSRDGACGCSCGDLVKKVAKMNVKKLRAFLHDYNIPILDTGTGKTELMTAAKKVARAHKNCSTADADCECARNGVPCHSDVCEGCSDDCHNPFQRYEYKESEVKQYRKVQLDKWRNLQQSIKATSSCKILREDNYPTIFPPKAHAQSIK